MATAVGFKVLSLAAGSTQGLPKAVFCSLVNCRRRQRAFFSAASQLGWALLGTAGPLGPGRPTFTG